MTKFMRVVLMVVSGSISVGCAGYAGYVVGLLVLAYIGTKGYVYPFWRNLILGGFSIFFAWKFGLWLWSPIFAKLRRVPMQVDWERRYGSSYLMPDAPWGKVGEECVMTGEYQVFRGEREVREFRRGEFFPMAEVWRNPHRARWEMIEYPLEPAWFLLGNNLVQKVLMIEREKEGALV